MVLQNVVEQTKPKSSKLNTEGKVGEKAEWCLR
jgi:hypothetical protein